MKKIFILFLVAVIGLFGCSTPEVTEIQNGIQFKTDSCIGGYGAEVRTRNGYAA